MSQPTEEKITARAYEILQAAHQVDLTKAPAWADCLAQAKNELSQAAPAPAQPEEK